MPQHDEFFKPIVRLGSALYLEVVQRLDEQGHRTQRSRQARQHLLKLRAQSQHYCCKLSKATAASRLCYKPAEIESGQPAPTPVSDHAQ